jgi:hypothetical protein
MEGAEQPTARGHCHIAGTNICMAPILLSGLDRKDYSLAIQDDISQSITMLSRFLPWWWCCSVDF